MEALNGVIEKNASLFGPDAKPLHGAGEAEVEVNRIAAPPAACPPSGTPLPTALAATKSPMTEFLEEWEEKGRSSLHYLHQRKLILKNPLIIHEANANSIQGWRSPMTFAVQTIGVVALLISCVQFAATHLPGSPITTDKQPPTATEVTLQKKQELVSQVSSYEPNQIVTLFYQNGSRDYPRDEALAVVQKEAAELESALKIEKDVQSLVTWLWTYLQPIFIGLALVLSSSFFKGGILKKFGNAGYAAVADRCYLYISSARTFWASILLNIMLLAKQWIPQSDYEDIVLEVFFAACILSLIAAFYARRRISKDLSAVLNLPDPKKSVKDISTQIGLSGIKALVLVSVCQFGLAFVIGYAAPKVLKYFV
jgi:hypothetical protein